MKSHRWDKLDKHSQCFHVEMERLRVNFEHQPDQDDAWVNKMKYLDIQLRRAQRQLSVHMESVESDMAILERGVAQIEVAKSFLL
ncbi:MAG: hypothetical protein Q9M14_08925 [Mariprofundaceae bacterium]|nr:hypothetical protein [Mariprofundaceae bacterium]